jgi:hypothetical protein
MSIAYTRRWEDYLIAEHAEPVEGDNVRCDGCFRTDLKCWRRSVPRTNPDVSCEACLRYRFGYDQAQGSTIRCMVAAAVSSLIDEGDPHLARAAVLEGFCEAEHERMKTMGWTA